MKFLCVPSFLPKLEASTQLAFKTFLSLAAFHDLLHELHSSLCTACHVLSLNMLWLVLPYKPCPLDGV